MYNIIFFKAQKLLEESYLPIGIAKTRTAEFGAFFMATNGTLPLIQRTLQGAASALVPWDLMGNEIEVHTYTANW